MNTRVAAMSLCVASILGVRTGAHDFPHSESTVIVGGAEAHARLALDLLELGGVDTTGDGVVSYDELDAQTDRVYAIVKQHFTVAADVPLLRMSAEHTAVVNDHVLQMDLAFIFASDVSEVTIRSTFHEVMRPDHQHATRVTIAGATERATLNAVTPQATFVAGGSRAMWRFARLGMAEAFAGYDRLALPVVLLVAASTFGMLLRAMVPFMLANAAAIGIAASGVIVFPAQVALWLVMFGILWVAAENLTGVRIVDRGLTSGVVGVFYGIRCSTMLSEQCVPRPVLPLAVTSYWVGMDLGQVAVVAVVIPLVALYWLAYRRIVNR